MTSSRLRELSRAASPAPWWDSSNAPSLFDGAGDSIIHFGDEVGPYVHDYDAALIVALRNDAEKYADLRDAGKALLAALCTGSEPHDWSDIDAKANAFRAALAALGGEE